MAEFVTVARTGDISPGEGRLVQAAGHDIALFNVEGTFYALDNTCVHAGGPLCEGMLEGTTVTCPWHAWSYDVRTGECTMNPAARVASYPVKVEEENVLIQV